MRKASFLASLLAAALVPLVIDAETVRAESISYSLIFCENLDVLKDPTNQTLMSNVSKASQHSLMMQRTTPYFELRNTSESAMLTQFSMTIGDLSKHFDWANLVESSPGVSFTLQTVDTVMGGLTSDVLTISFAGLAPGEFVRFRFGLGADDPGASYIQDYRTILFDLDGSDPSGNSMITVDFASGENTGQLVDQLPNFSMNGKSTATNMALPDGPCWDHVMPFFFGSSGTIEPGDPDDPGPVIPEPGSLALLGVGLAVLIAVKSRSGRRKGRLPC